MVLQSSKVWVLAGNGGLDVKNVQPVQWTERWLFRETCPTGSELGESQKPKFKMWPLWRADAKNARAFVFYDPHKQEEQCCFCLKQSYWRRLHLSNWFVINLQTSYKWEPKEGFLLSISCFQNPSSHPEFPWYFWRLFFLKKVGWMKVNKIPIGIT